jgi:hypothetical protein
MNKKIIIGGAVALGIVALIAVWLYVALFVQKGNTTEDKVPFNQEVVVGEPVDIVLDFYNPWLDAVKSPDTDPYTLGFATKGILSEELRARLEASKNRGETEIDPVLCQTTVPERVNGRIVSETADTVRVLVMTKEDHITAQSVFTLLRHNEGWFIKDILCSPGEFDIPREFTFEKEGFLLKSVPPPLNPKYWHLIFEENGEPGHFVPLFFTGESSCTALDGNKAPCDPNQFRDATKAKIFGQMTESGVTVSRLEFLE